MTLAQKLEVGPGSRVMLVGAPEELVPELVGEGEPVAEGPADVIVAFLTERPALVAALDGLRAQMKPAAGLWIAWPRPASGVQTDMTEDAVREVALRTGLVDDKVCALDATWNGLRLSCAGSSG